MQPPKKNTMFSKGLKERQLIKKNIAFPFSINTSILKINTQTCHVIVHVGTTSSTCQIIKLPCHYPHVISCLL